MAFERPRIALAGAKDMHIDLCYHLGCCSGPKRGGNRPSSAWSATSPGVRRHRPLQHTHRAKQAKQQHQIQMAWAGGSSVADRPPLTTENFIPTQHQSKTSTQHIQKAANASPLQRQPRDLLDTTFEAAPGQNTSLADFLTAMDTDGILVMHQGKVITEEYPKGMDPNSLHALASISRNFVASVTAILLERKQLDKATAVENYIPELADTGYAGATVQQLLDMRSGVTSSMFTTSKAMRFAEPDPSENIPEGLYALLLTLPKEGEHGGKFKYRAGDTDLLGLICERVTKQSLSELITELIWQPIGAEADAEFVTDMKGTPMYSGGMCASLHDVARFGLMWLNEGKVDGQQVLPATFVHETRHGDEDARQAFSGNFFGLMDSPGKMYKNQTWNLDEKRGTILMYGANGQIIYTDPPSQLLVAVSSNWPGPFLPDRVQPWFNALDKIRAVVASNGN